MYGSLPSLLFCDVLFNRSPLQGLPVTLYTTEELPQRFSFCLKLHVSNIKHEDSVLLVATYSLILLVTPASPLAQWRVVPIKSSFFEANFNFCNSETSPCPMRLATFLVDQLLIYKMVPTTWSPVQGKQKKTRGRLQAPQLRGLLSGSLWCDKTATVNSLSNPDHSFMATPTNRPLGKALQLTPDLRPPCYFSIAATSFSHLLRPDVANFIILNA